MSTPDASPDPQQRPADPPPAPTAYPGSEPPPAAYPAAPSYPAAPTYPSGYAQPDAAAAYPSAGYGYPAGPKTNTLAIVSLIAGLAGIFIVPLLASVAAIITGHMSLNQLKTSGENGRGLALAGTILGYVGVGFAVLLGIIIVVLVIAAASTTPYRG